MKPVAVLRIALVSMLLVSAPSLCGAAEETDVGGQVLKLGKLVLRVPSGWWRAPSDAEKEEEAYLFRYAGPAIDRGKSPRANIMFETDEFETTTALKDFFATSRKRLESSGWTYEAMPFRGGTVPRYTTPTEDRETLFLVSIVYGSKSCRVFFTIPEATTTLPAYAAEFLDGLRFANDPEATRLTAATATPTATPTPKTAQATPKPIAPPTPPPTPPPISTPAPDTLPPPPPIE